ncbi:MAG: hypothetical protein CENE_02583 [Candidatus Celerinatantimonas neptuna]|nr:MAG: hypothetical protein CENE_02583 [Candidatus Celerinatantimonas neptuna]
MEQANIIQIPQFISKYLLLAVQLLSLFIISSSNVWAAKSFVHPGLLVTNADFKRIRTEVADKAQPWEKGWKKLINNSHSSLKWKANPQSVIYRGIVASETQNYGILYNDAAAAFALAIRWKVTGNTAYADKAVEILNGWGSTLTAIKGSSDKYLAAGIYGYQLANAAEIMRTYPKWSAANFKQFKNMMLDVFYPMNHNFLVNHNGAAIDHYWSNWDLAQLNSMLAIGVLTDDRSIYDEAIDYFKNGKGNGAIHNLIWKVYSKKGIAQMQESGRDQGHALLSVGLVGSLAQMAWNQGDDLYGYDHNLILKGAEYEAEYNLGHSVPYTTYTNSDVTQTKISSSSRGQIRPIWERLYNHYVVLKGLKAPYVEQFAKKSRPEGGGGNYGPNSGGYDHLGYGTLLYSLPH